MYLSYKLIGFLLILLIVIVFIKSYENTVKAKISGFISLLGAISMLSFIWLLIILNLWLSEEKSMPLNNWGDYLAGFFSPMLFIWVVSGIYLQKKEFANAIDEYKRSVKFLKKQSINTDIQHKNTWFDRNADMLEKYIDLLVSHEKNDKGPLRELNLNMIGQTIYTYRDLALNVMNVVEHDKYIKNELLKSKNEEEIFNKALDNLLIEYNILFGKNVECCKNITLKFYLQIYFSEYKIEEDERLKEDIRLSSFYDLISLLTPSKKKLIKTFYMDNGINIDSNFIDVMSKKFDSKLRDLIIYEEKNETII